MLNLFAVESPLQALCAVEVALGQPNRKNHLIVHLSSNPQRFRNNDQILNIIRLYNWGEIHIHKINNYKTSMLKHYFTIKFLKEIEKKYRGKVYTLYIGEFLYKFMHLIRCAVNPPETILLDDGAATIKVIEQYIKHKCYYPKKRISEPQSPLKKYLSNIIYKPYRSESILSKKIKILTAFYESDITYDIKKLEFKNIQSMKVLNSTKQESQVYYFGGPYSEASIISLDYEVSFLTKICKYYADRNKRLIYFAHRDDSDKKLNNISKCLNVEIRKPENIAEFYLITSTTLPGEISGAITSILNNVKVLFPQMPVRSFILDKEKVSPKAEDEVFGVYNQYKEIGIQLQAV